MSVRPPRGLTLLEVVLALALTVILLTLVWQAMNQFLVTTDVRSTNIEQAQLARAVLRQMADDIRAAVLYEPVDYSEVQELAQDTFGVGAADDLLGEESELGDLLGEEGMPALDLTQTDAISGQASPQPVPGVYGNQFEIEIDVSRLPRIEELRMQSSVNGVLQRPGDVKTVAYYIGEVEPTDATRLTAGGGNDVDNLPRVGLIRRSVDRAVGAFAAETGNTELLLNQGELLAPEITAVEFRYFDGQQWLLEWDTAASQSLPVAVEIAIAIRPSNAEEPLNFVAGANALAGDQLEDGSRIYRRVVRLVGGEPVTEADLLGAEALP